MKGKLYCEDCMMLVRLAMQAYFLYTGEEEAVGEYARMLADAAKQGMTVLYFCTISVEAFMCTTLLFIHGS